eukprot:11913512-Alexandrium_andersonii.AAC.1
MPHAADPGAPADADGRAAVATHLQPRHQPAVLGNSDHAQTFAAPLTMPASSASPELKAMVFCVTD